MSRSVSTSEPPSTWWSSGNPVPRISAIIPELQVCVTAYTTSRRDSTASPSSSRSSMVPSPYPCHTSSIRSATSVSSPSHSRWPRPMMSPAAVSATTLCP